MPNTVNPPTPQKPGFLHQFWSQLWKTIVAGMLVWIPMMVTIWITWFFTDKLILGVEKLIKNGVDWLNAMGGRYPTFSFLTLLQYQQGLGILIAILLFLTTGFLTRYVVGRKLIAYGEYILQRIPVIRRVYNATKQIRDAILNRPGAVFQKVCVFEYLRPGLYAIGFITSEDAGVLEDLYGKKLVAIFVPTTPNPTSGYLVYVAPEEVTLLDITVEDAMKVIVSAGTFAPHRNLVAKLPEDELKFGL